MSPDERGVPPPGRRPSVPPDPHRARRPGTVARAAVALAAVGSAMFVLASAPVRADDPPTPPGRGPAPADPAPEVQRRVAAELWKAVEDGRRKELFADARAAAGRVLEFDPDHKAARAFLGFVRSESGWTADPSAASKTPTVNLPRAKPGTDLRVPARQWRHDVLRPATSKAAGLLLAEATRCDAAGNAAGATELRRRAVALAPDHEGARKSLGHVRWKDLWLSPGQAREADECRRTREVPGVSEFEAMLGPGLTRVESARVRIESRLPAERLRPLAEACEDVLSLLLADLGRSVGDAPTSERLRFVICTTPDQWNRWIDGTQEAPKRDFYRRLHGVWGPPWSYGVAPAPADADGEEHLRDHVLHRVAHWAVTQGFGVPWQSWLDEGLTHHYVLRAEGRTGTWCVNPAESPYGRAKDSAESAEWIDPSEWRDLAIRVVAAHDTIPLRGLGAKRIDAQPFVGAIQAWSVVSWLRATAPDDLRRFAVRSRTAGGLTQALEEVRGSGIDAVDAAWQRWVLED